MVGSAHPTRAAQQVAPTSFPNGAEDAPYAWPATWLNYFTLKRRGPAALAPLMMYNLLHESNCAAATAGGGPHSPLASGGPGRFAARRPGPPGRQEALSPGAAHRPGPAAALGPVVPHLVPGGGVGQR